LQYVSRTRMASAPSPASIARAPFQHAATFAGSRSSLYASDF
jgi:hypothetical protein